jgi:hypothetical protein
MEVNKLAVGVFNDTKPVSSLVPDDNGALPDPSLPAWENKKKDDPNYGDEDRITALLVKLVRSCWMVCAIWTVAVREGEEAARRASGGEMRPTSA